MRKHIIIIAILASVSIVYAGIKISDMAELTSGQTDPDGDFVEILDTTAGDNLKVTPEVLVQDALGESGKNIGIGTTSPSYELSIVGAAAAGAAILGIDTTADTAAAATIKMEADRPSEGNLAGSFQAFNNGVSRIGSFGFYRGTTDLKGELRIETSGTTQMVIDEDGNIGVGVTAPDVALEVAGVILTTPAGSRTCDADAEGGIMYNSGTNFFYGCDGISWNKLDN